MPVFNLCLKFFQAGFFFKETEYFSCLSGLKPGHLMLCTHCELAHLPLRYAGQATSDESANSIY
jgi:hypothetical protein